MMKFILSTFYKYSSLTLNAWGRRLYEGRWFIGVVFSSRRGSPQVSLREEFRSVIADNGSQ